MESLLSNDWSAHDREEWTANWLGECEKKLFHINQGFKVKVSKDGDDGLIIKDITVIAGKEECSSFLFINMGCEILERESFSCGYYHLGLTQGGRKQTRQTNTCRTREYGHHTIKKVSVEIGDDGTDDDVHIEICSDVDNRCCDTVFNSWANDFQSKECHLKISV